MLGPQYMNVESNVHTLVKDPDNYLMVQEYLDSSSQILKVSNASLSLTLLI
jgi:hypothetical protein